MSITEIALPKLLTYVFQEFSSFVVGHLKDRKLKTVIDQMHRDYFFNRRLAGLRTDVRISVFGKSKMPFSKKFTLRARSLDIGQASKKKFSRSLNSSGPHDGVVGYILTIRKPYVEDSLPCYRTGSDQDKLIYKNKTHMLHLKEAEIVKFKYFARSYVGGFVQHNDQGSVKYVILLESENVGYFKKKISASKIQRDFLRIYSQ